MISRKFGSENVTSIYEKCNAGDYEPNVEYPDSDRKIKQNINMLGSMLSDTMYVYSEYSQMIKQTMDKVSPLLRILEENQRKRKEYNQKQSELHELFRKDLIEYFDTKDYPDEPSIFNLAWEEGHANGYHEVASHYSEIVEKFEKNIKRMKDLKKLLAEENPDIEKIRKVLE